VDPAPLSELHEHLRSRDLDAARAVLHRTAWTNLANVLRALPEDEKRVASDLLDPATAAQLRERLTDQERDDLDPSPHSRDAEP
jgi:Mg/Co/Ni transporter MgtE